MKNIFDRQSLVVARLSFNDPSTLNRVLSSGNPPGGKHGRGRPSSTRVIQVEGFYQRVVTDREQAWALAKQDAVTHRIR